MLGIKPGEAPRETNIAYRSNQFLGSAYMDRLKLNPEYDYRFLGDAAFDTRYVSNAMLNKTEVDTSTVLVLTLTRCVI